MRIEDSVFLITGGGSGLGLAIVAAIARAHGGDARVGESSPDGTTMVVEIPALAQEVS